MRKVKEFVKLSLKLLNKIHIVLLAIGIISVFFSGCVVRNTKIRPITKFERKELPTEIPGPLFLTMYVDTMTTISMWGYSFVDSGNNVVTFYWPDANLAFSKFVPELYSDTTSTIPIVIKITVDDYGKKSFMGSGITRRFWLAVQLSPEKYSNPVEIKFVDKVKDWRKKDKGVMKKVYRDDGRIFNHWVGNWSYKYFSSEHDENFIKMISEGIVECLNQLSSKEIELVLNNPEAWKCYQEQNPFGKSHFRGGTHDVLIDVASEESQPMKAEIVETEYNESSGRGSVVIIVGNTDRILLLKWVKDEVLPGLLGQNKSIRILGEETLSNQKIKFKFEVIE